MTRPFFNSLRNLGLIALAFALAACDPAAMMPGAKGRGARGGRGGRGGPVASAAIPVETLKLTEQDFEERFTRPGVIEPMEEVTVSSEIAARVLTIGFDMGDEVNVGDALVTLDDASAQADIRRTEAGVARLDTEIAAARKNLAREIQLRDDGAGSEVAVDDARERVQTLENDLAATQAEKDLLDVNLKKYQIASPMRGRISERAISAGEYVTPGTRLYEIVQIDEVKFVFALGERDVPRVHANDRIEIEIDAFEGEVFAGPIRAIAPAGNMRSRTFRVEVALGEADAAGLRPGMSGQAELVRARYEGVYILPEDAVIPRGEATIVYLALKGKAEAQTVTVVARIGARVVIAADFEAGKDVIITGQYAVEPGRAIWVRNRHEKIPARVFN